MILVSDGAGGSLREAAGAFAFWSSGAAGAAGAALHLNALDAERARSGRRAPEPAIGAGAGTGGRRCPANVGEVAEAPDRQELLTALTTEHFTLQGARSQTASESASRASLYILSVSSTLVALGFIGQASEIGTAFDVFALTVLPTLYVLGVFTFVRVVECGAEDFRYGVAINRIRNYYKQIAGDQAKLFLLSGHDDGRGVFENAAVPPERRTQFFTFATVVAVINSVVGGSAIAIALGAIAETSLGVAAGVGGGVALVSLVALLRYADRLLKQRTGHTESIFPSPRRT